MYDTFRECLLAQERDRIESVRYYYNIVQGFNRAIRLLKQRDPTVRGRPQGSANTHNREVIRLCQLHIGIVFDTMRKRLDYFDSMKCFKKLVKSKAGPEPYRYFDSRKCFYR